MQNSEITRIFEELADLLEIQSANPFRVRAYRNAARTIGDLPEPVAEILRDPARRLDELPGIGADLAGKVTQIVETGMLSQLEELRAQVPAGVVAMLRIPGVGPKKAAALFKELGVTSLETLREACESGAVAKLRGFGAKTAAAILDGLTQAEQAVQRLYLAEIAPLADEIVADLKRVPGVARVEAAGSFRRRRETVGDLDVLVIAADSAAAMDALAAHPQVAQVLVRGETKQRVRLKIGLEMDLRVVPEESYGAALQYFTGSKDHNIVVRRRAQERGLKINEYGVFRGDRPVAGRTEEEVYGAVDLPWIPPELRENRGELERAEQGRLPRLIELYDIRGDLHMHTTATDGAATIAEMIDAAKHRGYEYIAITDHSQRVSMANGLDAKRLRAHWREIVRIREQVKGIEVLCGIECDILEDATLDLSDDVLAEADWVIAVLHYGLKQHREQIMKRLLMAIRSPHVHAIGHLTGRMIGKRPPAEMNMDEVLRAAADHGKWIEINAHPSRLDIDDLGAAQAKSLGIPIIIDTDAHSVNGFEVMRYGIYQARRAGLEAKDVVNTRAWKEFQKLLRRHKSQS
ncbi:MAG: DNA polymerase/3'-5' exonuclease PolX [Planctomycetaceae bacterium]|nr:MAG: DNA polymerase/3'-5' exonuclease PolX [Planctomycetaceae bacterium]